MPRALAPLATLLAACQGPPAPHDPPTWDDVAPILASSCVGCHDRSGLTYALTTWSEAAPLSPLIHEYTGLRKMPPWPAGPADVDYLGDPSLTRDEIATLAAWDDGGARLGADPDEPLVAGELPHLDPVSAELEMPEAYTPAAGVDDFRCFVLDRSGLTDPWVTGVEAFPDVRAEVHHLVLHAVVPDDPADDPVALDASDPGPGFACPGPLPGDDLILGGWLPGRGPSVLPQGLGLPLDPGARLVLEMHYVAPVDGAAPDRTTVAVATSPSIEEPAWQIVANATGRTGAVAVAAGGTATRGYDAAVSDLAGPDPVRAWWIVPHMHTHGTRITVDRVRGGTSTRLVDIPAWDFDWQLQYSFAEPVELLPSDRLHLTCTYADSGPDDVLWGPSTGDEMCLARLLLTAGGPAPAR